ncbi:hypothetical protein HYT05_02575 [Candidatus Kaiserbacteria bacterium]|nr:hypothetical protein [Candidatus Kaiserbacteria bacterium]
MSDKTTSTIPVTRKDLAQSFASAASLLKRVSYAPKKDLAAARAERAPQEKKEGLSFESIVLATRNTSESSVSIFEIGKKLSGGDDLLFEDLSHTFNAVRTGIQLGLHIGNL